MVTVSHILYMYSKGSLGHYFKYSTLHCYKVPDILFVTVANIIWNSIAFLFAKGNCLTCGEDRMRLTHQSNLISSLTHQSNLIPSHIHNFIYLYVSPSKLQTHCTL